MIECRLTQYPIFVIDSGRKHAGAAGVSESGAMDRGALRLANRLLNQPTSTSALEVMGECELLAHSALRIVITGGDADITIESIAKLRQRAQVGLPNQVIDLLAGQSISIGRLRKGMRLVIGIAGGLDVPVFFQSQCGILREKFGGLGQGRPMLSGDRCAIGQYRALGDLSCHHSTTNSAMSHDRRLTEIDFVPNYQYEKFSIYAKYLFTTQSMQVSANSDRMGLRLHCSQPIASIVQHESQALALGVVQIPPDGKPIVMGPDRQTHGGYPVIGTVPEYALNKLAQLRQDETFKFSTVNIETAIAKYWLSVR